jgi:adenosylcobinamide-GDP ribazoletransferase
MTSPGAEDRPVGARSRLTDGLLLALGTLTAVPVPAPRVVDRRAAGVAMAVAPVVGLVPGGFAAAVVWAATAWGAGPMLAAVLGVGVLALATRGLHLDGLADTADAFAASYDRERALHVMRSGDTGPAGAAVLVLVLLLQVAALAQALPGAGPVAVLVAAVVGRVGLPLSCIRGVPAARTQGLGALVAGTVPRPVAALVVVVLAVCGILVGRLGADAIVAPALAALAVAGITTAVLVARAVRRFGGVTGDVLGACVEAGTAAALVSLALGA